MSKQVQNRVWFTVFGTPGTGIVTIGTGVSNSNGSYLTPAQAGFANADTFTYCIVDGNKWEEGTGTYISATGSFSRVVSQSYNAGVVGTSTLSVTNSATVMLTLSAAEIIALQQNPISRTATATLLAKLGMLQNANVLIIGDSTGYDSSAFGSAAIFDPAHAWPRKLFTLLGAAYPAYTVTHQTWGSIGQAQTGFSTGDGTTTTIQTGAGSPPTLTIYDAGVPGSDPLYLQGARWQYLAALPTPDLIIINHSQNATTADSMTQMVIGLVEQLRNQFGPVQILLIAQTWGTNSPAIKKQLNAAMYDVAGLCGCDLIDFGQITEANGGNSSTANLGDGTHPTVALHTIFASTTFSKRLTWITGMAAFEAFNSSLDTAGDEMLADNYFSQIPDPNAGRGAWIMGVAGAYTPTIDGTQVDLIPPDSSTGTSLLINGLAGQQEIKQVISVLPSLWGKYVTFTTRMYRPYAASFANRGALVLYYDSGQYSQQNFSSYGATADTNLCVNGWFTAHLSIKIPLGTTYLTSSIYVAPNNTPASQMWVQWASLSVGRRPRKPPKISVAVDAARGGYRPVVFNTPASGATITAANSDKLLILRHAATIATLTVNLPPNPVDNQEYSVNTTFAVTALTLGAGGNIIYSQPAGLAAFGSLKMHFNAAGSRWYPVT